MSDEEYEKAKKAIRDGFELKLTVTGTDGHDIFGSINDVFNSPNFPDELKSIFVNSELVLTSQYNIRPRNSFQLFLDFTKPSLLDLSLTPSLATPNQSNFTINGLDATWVHGLFSEFNEYTKNHRSNNTWIHKQSIYDLLIFLFGIPITFWVIHKSSHFINSLFGGIPIIVQGAAYLYLFFIMFIFFRFIFQYARWIWPIIEYRSPRNKAMKHRIIISAISLGLISSFLYDIVKYLH